MTTTLLQVSDIERLHWKFSEADGPVTLDARSLSGVSLAAAVELASLVAFSPPLGGAFPLNVRLPASPITGLLKTSRWSERASPVKLRDGDTTVIVQPTAEQGSWWTQCLRDLLSELKSSGFPDKLAQGLTGAVAEMADNVWLHGSSGNVGLICYQVRRRKLAFSVLDQGIGILGSLRTSSKYAYLTSSMEAVRLALQPGVSRLDYGGLGFPKMMNALTDLWGNVRVRSGEAAILLDGRGDLRAMHRVYLPILPGTHVSVRCSLDRPQK